MRIILIARCGRARGGFGGLLECRTRRTPDRVQVVAAENFWGSIARQIGGERRRVDEHRHATPTPTRTTTSRRPGRARRSLGADLVIENGIGYDPWAQQLLDADVRARPQCARRRARSSESRTAAIRTSGTRRRRSKKVIAADRVRSRDDRSEPPVRLRAQRAPHSRRRDSRSTTTLIAQIRHRYSGTPIGASESIVAPLGGDARLAAAHARVVPRRDRRGQRACRAPTRQLSTSRFATTRSRCSCSTARTRRPTCSGSSTPRIRRTSRS